MTAEFRRLAALLLFSVACVAQAKEGADFCPIHPIALPQTVLEGKQVGDQVVQLSRGTGAGNFSWLTWTGANDAPTLATSLLSPGDSGTYVNPDEASDHRLDIADWAQGAPGSMNATAVRERLDALKAHDIIVPTWDSMRGRGSNYDYRVQRFVTIRLTDYLLTGQGWLSFEYRGEAVCYNQPPLASPQSLLTDEDAPLPLTLSGSDPDDDSFSFRIIDGPEHGVLGGEAPDLVYTPAQDFHGADAFTFVTNDGVLDSGPARIEIIVRPLNDSPLADGQVLATDEEAPLPITLTGSDVDGDALNFHIIGAPAHGIVSGEAPNLIYTPHADYHGEDAIVFVANDGELDSTAAQVAITVLPVNDAPVALPQALTTPQDEPLAIALTGSDVDGDVLDFRVIDAPQHGSLSGEGAALTYTPDPGFHGDDDFRFVAHDGALDSAPVVVTIMVKEANLPPQIVSTPPATALAGDGYRYDVDAVDPNVGDVLGYRIDKAPSGAGIDGSSGVIEWLADVRYTQGTRARNLACRTSGDQGVFDPVVRWHWQGSGIEPAYNQVMMSPLLVQTTDDNGDGRIDTMDAPDVVFVSHTNGRVQSDGLVRVVNGHDGHELASFTVAGGRVASAGGLAAGDIDGDGIVEIVGTRSMGGLVAFEHDGQIKWTAATPGVGWNVGSPSIADLDGDGKVEILFGKLVYSAEGQLKWAGSGAYIGSSASWTNPGSFAADVHPSPGSEVVAGPSLYSASGELLWLYSGIGDGYAAVGDLDRDSSAEVVVVGNGKVVALSAQGRPVWGPVALTGGGLGGPPTLADVDGDGQLEVGVASSGYYYVFDHAGQLLWSHPVVDVSSSETGSSSFDFQGDGRSEVVHQDEHVFRVFDGRTGEVVFELPNETGTSEEYPVVADADADGSADILLVSNRFWGGSQTGVRMISSGSRNWMPTRSIWNQHAYHIDNINDDGTVPRQPAKSWLTHNTFRLNTFPDRHPLGLPDLALFDLRLDESEGTTVEVRVVNRGLAPTGATTSVHLFNGDPDVGGELLGLLEVPPLAAGEERVLRLSGLPVAAVSTDLYARIDRAGVITECLEDNNGTIAAYFEIRATDSSGLFDTQRFAATVEAANHAPSVLTSELANAQVGRDYRFVVEASDPDIGDGLRFELVAAPEGLQIESVSGELRWNPLSTQVGTHAVQVRVVDLGGLVDEQNYSLTVDEMPASTVRITSEPETSVEIGSEPKTTTLSGTVRDFKASHPDFEKCISGVATGLVEPVLGDDGTPDLAAPSGRGCITSPESFAQWFHDVDGVNMKAPLALSFERLDDGSGRYQFSSNSFFPIDGELFGNEGYPHNYHFIAEFHSTFIYKGGEVFSFTGDDDVWVYIDKRLVVDIGGIHGASGGSVALDQLGLVEGKRYQFDMFFAERHYSQSNFVATTTLAFGKNTQYRYQVVASSDAALPISYRIEAGPEGMTLDAVTGLLLWAPSVEQIGPHEIVVVAETADGAWAEQAFVVEVVDGGLSDNRSPQVDSLPNTKAAAGNVYQYQVAATDADGDSLSYALLDAPAAMQVEADTGLIEWVPGEDDLGSVRVEVVVSDGKGGFGYQAYYLEVTQSSNQAPAIESAPATLAEAGATYRYAVEASDADGDALSFSLAQAPEGMTIDVATGVVTWTPVVAGGVEVEIRVDDGKGGFALQSYTLTVTDSSGGNHAPVISSTPSFVGKVGREYRYAVQASDADGDALAYSLARAPDGMLVGSDGVLTWTPADSGSQFATVRVSDGSSFVEQSWSIDVVPADVALDAIVRASPNPVDPGGELTVTIEITGAAGPVTITATLDGEPITLTEGGNALVAPSEEGPHLIHVGISDGFETVAGEVYFTVGDALDSVPPEVKLILPAPHPDHDSVEITAPTSVTGFVTGSDVTQWLLAVRETGSSATRILAQGQGEFSEKEIAQFAPTLLENGQYHLILQAQDSSGNVASDYRIVRVDGDMKIGHFSITFEDVSIPVAGIPVTVTRTYDSRRSQQSLDFGYGWTVDYRSVRIQESRRPGFAWDVYRSGALGGPSCIRPMGDPIITVGLPGGDVASFRAKVRLATAESECSANWDPYQNMVYLEFEAVDGNDYELEQTDYGVLKWSNVQGYSVPILWDEASGDQQPVDPQHYRLTTPEGLVYELEQGVGIRKISEPTTGATLTYTSAGVKHSSGVGIDFIRDAAGRITQMKLPDGNVIEYGYTPAGDLDIVLDAAKEITSFAYATQLPHYLQDIVDPRGVRVARNEYDDDGRLVAIIDAEGHRTEYEHAISDRIERVKDRNGNVSTYVFDERGRVTHETNAIGETILRSYDEEGNVLSETDALGRTTTRGFDARGNLLSETNAAGETTSSSYNGKDQLLTQADAAGRTVLSNEYDTRTGLLLTASTDALNHRTSFGYVGGTGMFGTGQLEAITDASGASTLFTYDAKGNKANETDALGNVTSFAYDDMGRVTRETRTRSVNGSTESLVTTYRYDAKGRLLETTHPDGSKTTAEYAGLDQPVKECDALGRCSVTEFDARGNVARIIGPDGSAQSKQYDGNGNVIAETDGNGHTTRFVYDAANRLVETVNADGTRTRNVYDKAGQLVEAIDENGRSTRYEYDLAGRRVRTILPEVASETATVQDEYDDRGRRVASIDPNGERTAFVYDAAGRLLETVFTDGSRRRTEYDAVGRKTAEIDEMGRITRYGYDKLGRLTVVVLPNPATGANPPLVDGDSPDAGALVTRYAYDEAGNKLTQNDAEGRVTRWEYDVLGREIARILPEGQREEKRYDAAGQLLGKVDFKGVTTGYDYDLAGRLQRIDYANDADVTLTYDGNGQRVEVRDARGSSTRAFDARGRLIAVNDADGGRIEYDYDPAGNLQARILPSQSLVYAYDARNRLSQVTRTGEGEAAQTASFAYDAAGRRTAMQSADGVRSEYRFDRRGRLTDLVKRSAAGVLLAAMSYQVDASGLRTGIEEFDAAGATRSVAYQYDGVKRLIEEAVGHRDPAKDRLSGWTYDRVGNRLTQTVAVGTAAAETTSYSYDGNDRLLSESGNAGITSYSYDDNGNTLTKSGAGQSTSYRYNDADRLIEARTPEATIHYGYDADGLRTSQTVVPTLGAAVTTWYVQDPGYAYAQVVEQYVAEGSGPKRIAASYAFADELLSQTRYGEAGVPSTAFVQADGFGSTRWITDAAGNVTDAIDYDAFGVEIGREGSTPIEHLYRSERWDANVAAYDLRARLYTPGNGRFLTQDSFVGFSMDPQSLHKYGFNHNDPINRIDPSGHLSFASVSVQTVMTVGLRASVSMFGTRRVLGAFGRAILAQRQRQLIRAAALSASVAVVKALVQTVVSTKRNDFGINILSHGSDIEGHAEHILDSQMGGGSGGSTTPWLLSRSTRYAVDYNATPVCDAFARDAFAGDTGSRGVCDEYPFATSLQGGPGNYAAKSVSLRMLPRSEGSRQGALLSRFYGRCGVVADGPAEESTFVSVVVPFAPSFFGCKNGEFGWGLQ